MTVKTENTVYGTECQFILNYRGWLMNEVSEGPYTGNLLGSLDDLQVFLDKWEQNPTDQNFEVYENRKHTFFLMLEGAGL